MNAPEQSNDLVQTTSPADDQTDKTMSLLGGIVGPDNLPEVDDLSLPPSKSGRGVGSGTILIIVVILIACGALYAMRVGHKELKSDDSLKAVYDKVDFALAKLAHSDSTPQNDPLGLKSVLGQFGSLDSVAHMFQKDASKHQVPLEYLKKNPFLLGVVKAKEVTPQIDPVEDAQRREREHQQRLARLKAEAGTLRLQSVIMGRRPLAIINDEIMKQGDRIGSFTIKRVHELGVDLESEGQTITLTLGDAGVKATKKGLFRR